MKRLVALLPLLSACGGGLATVTELEGAWDTGCVPYVDQASASLRSRLLVTGNYARVEYASYFDGSCVTETGADTTTKMFLIRDEGQLDVLDLGPTEKGEIGWRADAFLTGPPLLNETYFGTRYSIYAVTGDTLRVGHPTAAGTGKSEALRHVELAPYSYSQRSQ